MKKAFIQLHIAIFLAGFTAVLGKLIGLNEGLLVWYRLLLTVLVLGGWMLFSKSIKKLPLKAIVQTTAVGMIIVFHWVCFYGSIKYANASVALVCLSAAGFFTALLEPLLFRKSVVLGELLLGLLAVAGIYIIFDFHPQYKTGIIFGILSSFGSALFPIFNKQLLKWHAPQVLTLYELGGGLIMLTLFLPLYLYFFPASYYLPTTHDWQWLLVLAVVCTVICFDLQLHALKKISPFTANLSYNLEPVYGIILAFIFLGESKLLKVPFYAGVALIITAVVLQMLRVRLQQKPIEK
jgi:drug/metabolite transporter (DMT)-like permease